MIGYALGIPITPSDNAAVAVNLAVTAVSTANRLAMPQVAAAVDQLRDVFGPVRVIDAVENGRELGQPPEPGVIAHPPHIPHSRVNRPDGGSTLPARTSHGQPDREVTP